MVTPAMTELMEKVAASPVGVEALKEMEDERLANRAKLVDEIQVIRDKIVDEQPKHKKAVEAATEKVEAAFEALQLARRNLGGEQATASTSSASRQIAQLENSLIESSDKASIRAFTDELDQLHHRVRGGAYTRPQTTERRIDGNHHVKDPGNYPEVSACLSQINDVRREARDQLPLEPLTQDQLRDRLQALRDSINLPQR